MPTQKHSGSIRKGNPDPLTFDIPGAILAAGFYKLIKVLQAENEDSNDNEREPLLS